MSALTFDKKELGNLEYSLQREMLSTDRRGGYMSTTIVCCNTRRFHGLIIAPIDDSDRTYLLLSSLDETIVQHDQSFNLALHRFKGTYEPRGHKYMTDFAYTPVPSFTYRVGGVILRKEMLWIHKRTQLMIRYTLVEANSSVKLRLRPFLAFRDKYALTHANLEADGRSYPSINGVKCRLYEPFPWLYLQTDKPGTEFVPAPDWYYNFEYLQDLARGYDGYEDLLTTGYFEADLKKGESIIFSASLEEMASPKAIREQFDRSIDRRTHKIDFHSCMEHAARQFIIRRPGDRTEVIAGYPWHGVKGRETFVSIPGLTLHQDHKEDCMDVIDTQVRAMQNGMFTGTFSAAHAADAPLWFFWTLQQLEKQLGGKEIWKRYGKVMKGLLDAYRNGIAGRITLHENGLLWVYCDQHPMTWMDSVIDGRAVTPRNGYQVEISALWYNAVCYTLALAEQNGDKEFVEAWKALPAKTAKSFNELFILSEGYLADYVGPQGANDDIRPNMVIACALPYKMVDEVIQVNVLRTIRQHLLTPRGLRTLSPRHPLYRGSQEGTPTERDFAGKNGSVWAWPLSFYARACFDIDGKGFLSTAEQMIENFNEDFQTYGIGSICELFDADPPFASRGAISHAWSVAAVLDIEAMIDEYKGVRKPKKRAAAAEAACDEAPKRRGCRKTAAAKAAEAAPAAETTAEPAPKKRCCRKPKSTK